MKISKVKVKEAMEKQGIKTQTELASIMNITKNQLSVVLADSYCPVKASVEKLCSSLMVAPEDIMGIEEQLTSQTDCYDENSVTAIELFAGAGGLALGLEQAGIHTLEYVEFNKFCCDTLRNNCPDWNVVCADIHDVSFKEFEGKIDIVTGGFPCQAFSFAGYIILMRRHLEAAIN